MGDVRDFEGPVGKERDDCRLLAYYFAEFCSNRPVAIVLSLRLVMNTKTKIAFLHKKKKNQRNNEKVWRRS